MGTRKIFWCDLCREEFKPEKLGELYGLNFTNNWQFKVDSARSTDGQHVCHSCAAQLVNQLRDCIGPI